jgi:hypothetical protein
MNARIAAIRAKARNLTGPSSKRNIFERIAIFLERIQNFPGSDCLSKMVTAVAFLLTKGFV